MQKTDPIIQEAVNRGIFGLGEDDDELHEGHRAPPGDESEPRKGQKVKKNISESETVSVEFSEVYPIGMVKIKK